MLCVDEKAQVQALGRARRSPPLAIGYVEGCTHIRHGTNTLFTTLDVAAGKGLAHYVKRHRHQAFLTLAWLIDKEVPPDLDVHPVANNFATHKHATVKAWLTARPRYHVHFTPTYSSWLN